MSTEKRQWWVAGLLAVILLGAIIAIILYVYRIWQYIPPEIALPLFTIAGVAGLLAFLTLASVVLAALNLADRNQAFALPRGSVRALIALSLIIIYVTTATYMFRYLTYVKPEELSDEAVAFAQQTLTTVSTLVVAVAGFYFGTRAREAARDAVGPPDLRVVVPTSPAKLANEAGKTLSITIATTPIGEAINWEVEGDVAESLVQMKPTEFRYTRSSSAEDIVTLKFALVKHPDVMDELKIEPPAAT